MIAQLPLLSRSGGTDVLSEGLMVISLVLHLLYFFYLSSKGNKKKI
jgi:heme/copper-type cytochrome/quinol oxidase subunit 4